MKQFLLVTILIAVGSITSFTNQRRILATWYHTTGTIVHRDYPTAAMNGVPMYSKFEVTNTSNNKSCIVTITDRMRKDKLNNIDLSYSAFGLIEDHRKGVTTVIVSKFNEL